MTTRHDDYFERLKRMKVADFGLREAEAVAGKIPPGSTPMAPELRDLLNDTTIGDAADLLGKIRQAAAPEARRAFDEFRKQPPFPVSAKDQAALNYDVADFFNRGLDAAVGSLKSSTPIFESLGVKLPASHANDDLFVELGIPPGHPVLGLDQTVAGNAPAGALLDRLRIIVEHESVPPDGRRKMGWAIQRVIDGEESACDISFEGNAFMNGILIRIRRQSDLKDFEKAGLDLVAMSQGPIRLERPQGSALHRLIESFHAKKIHVPASGKLMPESLRSLLDLEHQLFLIEHDWLSAFAKATDFATGEFRLPFPMCLFETRINGRRLIMRLDESETGILWAVIFVETSVGWSLVYCYSHCAGGHLALMPGQGVTYDEIPAEVKGFQPIAEFVFSQARAICISLEAEIATTEIVRAPHKLNRQREKAGKLPIYDYHSVSLVRRHRVAPSETPAGVERAHPRLHFVRGHWRHYAASKTWIKWHLRGDPDLGFIDKHYRL